LLRPKKHSIHPTDLHLLLSTIYSSSPRSRRKPTSNVDSSLDLGDEPPSSANDGEAADWTTSPLTEPGLESWLPICLPRFNAKGFLHAYVSFLSPTTPHSTLSPTSNPSSSSTAGGGIGLVLLSSDREGFVEVKEAAEGIKERLLNSTGAGGELSNRKGGKAGGGLVHEIEKARGTQEYSLGQSLTFFVQSCVANEAHTES
jgi:hypothetical protein